MVTSTALMSTLPVKYRYLREKVEQHSGKLKLEHVPGTSGSSEVSSDLRSLADQSTRNVMLLIHEQELTCSASLRDGSPRQSTLGSISPKGGPEPLSRP
jgi:hypothetical protein